MSRFLLLSLGVLLPVLSMLLIGCRGQLSLDVNGAKRTYQLYVPEGATEPMPLVVALHPFLLNGAQMRLMTGFDEIAEREKFVVAYPDGKRRRWDVRSMDTKDVTFIRTLIDTLVAQYDVDPQCVYLTGASNGAMMCHLMSCRAADKIAAIAPVMGTPPKSVLDGCADAAPMPILIIHGTADPIVHYDTGTSQFNLASVPETVQFWTARNGCTGEPSVTSLPDADPNDRTTIDLLTYPCNESAPVLLYRVNGGGHTWPGGGGIAPQFIVGQRSNDINASEIIWDFFKNLPSK